MTFPFRWLHNHPTKQTPPPFSRKAYDQHALAASSLGLKLVSGRLKSPDVAKIWILARVAEGFAAIAR